MSSKQCNDCREILPLSDFYQIIGKDEVSPRWERSCKACKKRRKRVKCQAQKEMTLADTARGQLLVADMVAADLPTGDGIFKRYVYPDGSVLELTKEEFHRVCEYFMTLWRWDRERQRRSKGKVIAPANV